MAGLGKGLGKGFDVLMPTEFDQSLLLDSSERIQKLLTETVSANPDQPRRHFDEAALAELAASIKRYGILQPLVVSPAGKDAYRIVAGERRWRAAKLAGLTHVPAIVRERKELEELEIALVENVQRVDLSPIEQAVSVERLHQQFNLSYKQIAERLGKAETTLSNIVRLLQLPEPARIALQNSEISEGHARAILALKNMPDKQGELLRQIIEHGWSVRQAEQFVVGQREGATTQKAVKQRMAAETPETKRISTLLHAPVSIKRTAKGGRLELHFKSDEELAKLFELLEKLR
jgi:ParB family chromosome partitioning protein